MITGGVCFDDLVVLREEETFKTIWRHGDIPHPTTMGDFLRRFDLGHIRQLESVISRAFKKVYATTDKMSTITMILIPHWMKFTEAKRRERNGRIQASGHCVNLR